MTRRTILQAELDNFSIEDDGRLYWKDKAVILERRIGLEGPTFWIAFVAAAATVASALWPIIDYLWLP